MDEVLETIPKTPSECNTVFCGRSVMQFAAIVDGASDILKRGRRWRGFDSKEEGKEDGPSLFDFFGLNTG